MRKVISYVLVFVLGFGACAYILNKYGGMNTLTNVGVTNAPLPLRASAPAITGNATNAVADVVEQITPAVVNIDTVGRTGRSPFPGLNLPDFFGLPDFVQPEPPKGQGSGVIIRPEGYILTNNHVVADAQSVTVRMNLDGGKVQAEKAKVVGIDPNTDLAVLKIPPRQGGYPYARFGDSSKLRIGDSVVAIGNALGLGTTVTVGVVSAKERALAVEGKRLENAIQTDAAINRGNSGGALLDISGQLIGINTAIASTQPGGGSIGIGFAIPSNTAQKISNDLITRGKVVRPWIGIAYRALTDDFREGLKRQGASRVPSGDGILVLEVINGSPADKSGLQPLDVILKVDGKKAVGDKSFAAAIERKKPGDTLTLEVWRAETGRTSRMVISLGEMPQQIP